MAISRVHTRTDLNKLVEKQLRNWELARAQQPAPAAAAVPAAVRQFVTISRTVSSGGFKVAAALGEKLGWPVFDREILHVMAGDDRVRAQLYEHLDERDESWLEDALHWVIEGELRKDDFFCRLTETVLALARKGPAVFLGRAADLILPQDHGLRVRVIAPFERRVQALALLTNTTEAVARPELERIDEQRMEFRRHHFGPHANEETRYDLHVNTGRFTTEQAVELIVAALRIRGLL